MASIVTDLAKALVEKLINGAISESRYICCFTSIAEDFEKENETLKERRTTVEQKVNVATRRAEDILRDVTFWREQADKILQEDTKTKVTCFFGWCPNCKWRYKRGKELENMTREIRTLMQSNFESVGIAPNLSDVDNNSSQHYISFKSRELKYKELLEALIDEHNYMIGLQGMGGTGKTTLAKEVGKELKQSKIFDVVIDTTVTDSPDIKKIQDDIASTLGLPLKDYSEQERCKVLCKRLTEGGKILVILDDVWRQIKFDEIGIPYNHKGCRVLLTTRNLWVCSKMGCERTIQLELLDEDEAWILFKNHALIRDYFSKGLIDKGREIVKECKGLPVAIAAIAGSLKGEQRQEEWDAALISLRKSMPVHGVEKNLIDFYKCLWYSYDRLENEEAKRLFLLCSLFPEDEEIPFETLARLGIAAGLFGEIEDKKYNEARTQVLAAKNKLIDSCLLLNAGEKKVKMHDLVRDVALWIANKEIQQINLSNKNHKSMVDEREKDIEYLLCEGNGKDLFSCRVNGSQLKVLLLNVDKVANGDTCNPLEIPNSFFENLTRLQVFHLSSYFSWFHGNLALSLPPSIKSLTTIRSLTLKRVELGDISILGNLQSLETLEFIECTLAALPHEISELGNLRLLNLHRCEFGRNDPFKVIERCKSLEELYFVDANDLQADSLENHKNIILHNLQRYRICLDFANDEDKYSSVSKYVGLEEIDVLFSEATFKYLVKTAETLWLRRMKGTWKNLMPDIISIDEGMMNLVELILENCSQMKCLIDINLHVLNVFPKLVALTLKEMENLQGRLFKSKMNLCNLKTMKLDKCPKLQSLFQVPTSRSLVVLEELIIEDCENLKNIIVTDEGQEDEIVDGDNDNNIKSRGSMFPKLRSIRIRECPKLEFILPFLSYAQGLPLLEVIKIGNCGELKYIFGQHQHDEHEGQGLHDHIHGVKEVILGSLREISLFGSPKFIDILEERNDPMCCSVRRLSSRIDDSKSKTELQLVKSTTNKRKIFPWTLSCCYDGSRSTTTNTVTEITPVVSNCKDQLQDHYSISLVSKYVQVLEDAECLSRQWHMMCNIKEITISGVAKLKSLFILSVAPTMLLESLIVESCDELKHIIAVDSSGNDSKWSNVFPKLKELIVSYCMELKYVIGEYPPHPDHDHDNDVVNNSSSSNQIHIQLPELTHLELEDLPKLMGICSSTSYRMTLPLLRKVQLEGCPRYIIKDLSRNGNNFVALEDLDVRKSKVENIVCLGDQQQMNLRLSEIRLWDLPDMMFLFMGPIYSFTLHNLTWLQIVGCEKLEVMFSACVARYLPQLDMLEIRECKELKQIVVEEEDYVETCLFPKLKHLVVKKCNKLKCVFPISTSKELPNKLQVMIIKEAMELEQVFFIRSEQQKKVELPNLELAVLVELPSLICPGIEFELQTHLFLHRCPKLISLTSSTTLTTLDELEQLVEQARINLEWTSYRILMDVFRELKDNSRTQDTGNENSIVERAEEGPIGVESGCGLSSSLLNVNSNYGGDGQVATSSSPVITSSEHVATEDAIGDRDSHQISPECEMDGFSKAPIAQSIEDFQVEVEVEAILGLELSSSVINSNSIENAPGLDIPLQKTNSLDNKINIEEGATSTNANTITSSTHFVSDSLPKGPLVSYEHKTYPKEYVDADHSHETSKSVVAIAETFASVSSNDDTSLKASSILKEHFSNDDNNIGVLESIKTSSTIPSRIASRSFSISFEDSKLIGGPCPNPRDIPQNKTHSHELLDEQSCLMNKQQPLGEASTTTFEIPQEKKDIKKNIEKVNTANAKIMTSSTHSESLSSSAPTLVSSKRETYPVEDGDGLIAAENPTTIGVDVSHSQESSRFAVSLAKTHDPVSLNDKDSTKVSSTIGDQFSINDDKRVSESKSSPTIRSAIASRSSFGGYPSQGVEDLNFASLITKELEELVSNKYLAYENLSLLTDFLIKHPSVRLTNGSFSNRNKGYAYNCLAELLKFLQTHSVFEVLESSHSDFVELLQDVRKCGFDKDWLDDVERRALFPGFQVSEEAMKKITDSKHILTQHVEDLKHQLESSEAVLESIIQQETQVLEARAALRAPIGY